MLENRCISEELNERKDFERRIRKFKAGSDLENALILNYLKESDRI